MVNPKTKIPEKKYYDVRVETMLPATLLYKMILAETPEQALQLTKNLHPIVQYRLPQKRDIKASVYYAGSVIIKYVKNLAGL